MGEWADEPLVDLDRLEAFVEQDVLGVACGNCGGPLFMATCHHFRGTGHQWVLACLCQVCRSVHWVESGCLEGVCRG